jgi:thiosulfate/3-mercaptopyruvate sulfurtransferase
MDMDQSRDQAVNRVVSAEWLYEHLDDPQVAIADCRFSLADPELGQRQYRENHIPGAYYFDLNRDLSSPVGQHGGRHPLPDVNTLAAKLSAIGVNSSNDRSENPNSENLSEPSLVVAYDDSRFAFAARFWWLLRYLGHERVAILDGGFSSWQAKYPVSQVMPEPKLGNFVPHVQGDRILDIKAVKSRQDRPGFVLVDSREGDRYRGEREPIDPVAGHIPGAINYSWQDVTTADGQIRSVAEQQQRWAKLASTEEIVVYCGSGVTACVNLFSLEAAGIRNAKLYPGSWSDWCSYL